MNTNLSYLKQFQNCHKKVTGTMDKSNLPEETVKHAIEALQKSKSDLTAHLTIRNQVIDGAFSFSSAFDDLTASGKGLNKEQAQASGIMELIERYSWLHFDYEKVPGYQVASYLDLKDNFNLVPESYFLANLLTPDDYSDLLFEILETPQKWVPAQSLTTSETVYHPLTWHSMTYSSNGLAAGNCLEEALLQGLCEVIERENVCRLFRDQRAGILVNPIGIKDPHLLAAFEQCAAQGIDIKIIDITYELGVPTFCVVGQSNPNSGTMLELGVGQGCHLDPEKALTRALTEYLESLAIQIANRDVAGNALDKLTKYLPSNHSGFLPNYNREMLSTYAGEADFSTIENRNSSSYYEDLVYVITQLAKYNYEASYIDKSHPQINVPVIRVVVPGLRSMMSGDIDTPKKALAQLHYENGNYEMALNRYKQYIDEDRTMRIVYSSPFMRGLALGNGLANINSIFSKDYCQYFIKNTKFKNQASKMVKIMTPLLALTKEI